MQADTAKLIYHSDLPTISLEIMEKASNGAVTRLMALKFLKSLFQMEPAPVPVAGVIEAVSGILQEVKSRLRNPTLLQSAVLEFINQFAEFMYKQNGKEAWLEI